MTKEGRVIIPSKEYQELLKFKWDIKHNHTHEYATYGTKYKVVSNSDVVATLTSTINKITKEYEESIKKYRNSIADTHLNSLELKIHNLTNVNIQLKAQIDTLKTTRDYYKKESTKVETECYFKRFFKLIFKNK